MKCAECRQPIAWFYVAQDSPLNGWIHTDLDGGDWSHRAQPPTNRSGEQSRNQEERASGEGQSG